MSLTTPTNHSIQTSVFTEQADSLQKQIEELKSKLTDSSALDALCSAELIVKQLRKEDAIHEHNRVLALARFEQYVDKIIVTDSNADEVVEQLYIAAKRAHLSPQVFDNAMTMDTQTTNRQDFT